MTTSQVDQSTLVAGRQAIQGTWRLDGRTDGRTMAISGLVNARSLHALPGGGQNRAATAATTTGRRTPAALINYGRRSGVSRRRAGFALTSAP